MSAENFYKWVEGRLKDSWTATAVQYDETPLNETDLDEYIRVTILPTSSAKTAVAVIPPARREHNGIVEVQIFTRELTGTRRATALRDTAAAMFRDVDVQYSINERWIFYEPSMPEKMPADPNDKAWVQHNVTIPYMHEEYQ